MKKKGFATTLAALLIANVQANTFFTFTPRENTFDLYLGSQIWQSEASGIFGEKNTLIGSNLKKEQQNNYFIAVEHPFLLLPNIRISSTTLDTVGETNLTQEFSIDDETFFTDADVDASFNASYVDYTLYYELFDNGLFSLDLGLTARDFDGAFTETKTTTIVTTSIDDIVLDGNDHEGHDHTIIETTNTVTRDKIKTNEIFPMLYVATNISLPLRGLSVFVQGDILLRDDHSFYGYQVGLNYDLVESIVVVDFNLNLGYRAVKMEFEYLDNLYTDLEFKGIFFGVTTDF